MPSDSFTSDDPSTMNAGTAPSHDTAAQPTRNYPTSRPAATPAAKVRRRFMIGCTGIVAVRPGSAVTLRYDSDRNRWLGAFGRLAPSQSLAQAVATPQSGRSPRPTATACDLPKASPNWSSTLLFFDRLATLTPELALFKASIDVVYTSVWRSWRARPSRWLRLCRIMPSFRYDGAGMAMLDRLNISQKRRRSATHES
jgi:hypothetical protein